MTTMSGSSSLTFAMASSPVSASPTTWRSGSASSSDLSPARSTPWSSAKRIVMFFGIAVIQLGLSLIRGAM